MVSFGRGYETANVGCPRRRRRHGDLVEPRQVHEGINKGGVPIKALATFIVEKGKPLATPAK